MRLSGRTPLGERDAETIKSKREVDCSALAAAKQWEKTQHARLECFRINAVTVVYATPGYLERFKTEIK